MVRACALLSCLALAGCSLSLSGPAADRRLSERPECDDSKGTVVADGVIGSAIALGALAAADDGSTGGAAALALLSAGYLLSAASGNRTVNSCREAVASFEDMHGAPIARDGIARRPARVLPSPPPPPVVDPPAPVGELIAQSPHVAMPAPGPVVVPVAPRAAPAPAPDPAWGQFWKEVP